MYYVASQVELMHCSSQLMRTMDDNYKGEEFNGVEWSVDNRPHVSISCYFQPFHQRCCVI